MQAIDVANGKYTVVIGDNGELGALRYRAPWRDLVGDNLVYWLAVELQEARNRIHELTNGVEGDDYVLYDQQTPEQEQLGELKEVFCNGALLIETSLAEIRTRLHG